MSEYLRNPFIDMELDPNAECKPEYLVLQSTKEVEKKKLKKIEKFKFVVKRLKLSQDTVKYYKLKQDEYFNLALFLGDEEKKDVISITIATDAVALNAVEIMRQFSNDLRYHGYDASEFENELENFLKLVQIVNDPEKIGLAEYLVLPVGQKITLTENGFEIEGDRWKTFTELTIPPGSGKTQLRKSK